MSQHPDLPSPIQQDPFDVLARQVPRHVWLSLAVVIATVVAGLLLFDPQHPPAAETTGETQTLEGKVLQVLSEDRIQAGDESAATYIQTVWVDITCAPLPNC
jgi:hypothetical protein